MSMRPDSGDSDRLNHLNPLSYEKLEEQLTSSDVYQRLLFYQQEQTDPIKKTAAVVDILVDGQVAAKSTGRGSGEDIGTGEWDAG